jgi:hypothetical protein
MCTPHGLHKLEWNSTLWTAKLECSCALENEIYAHAFEGQRFVKNLGKAKQRYYCKIIKLP